MFFFGHPFAQHLADGRKTVAAAGTREPLVASATPASWVIISALKSNTDVVVVGSDDVIAAEGSRNGLPLAAGACAGINAGDLHQIYLDVVVSGEGVTFLYGH